MSGLCSLLFRLTNFESTDVCGCDVCGPRNYHTSPPRGKQLTWRLFGIYQILLDFKELGISQTLLTSESF